MEYDNRLKKDPEFRPDPPYPTPSLLPPVDDPTESEPEERRETCVLKGEE